MTLYLSSRPQPFVYSYDPTIVMEDYRTTAYQTRWAFTMPGKNGRETFITVRALSIVRAEIMCGRGTLVWHVVKYDEEDEIKASRLRI